jgi:hypothetical protein
VRPVKYSIAATPTHLFGKQSGQNSDFNVFDGSQLHQKDSVLLFDPQDPPNREGCHRAITV